MRLGWKMAPITTGLRVGVVLALTGCNTVTGVVDGLSRQVKAIVSLVSPDEPNLKAGEIVGKDVASTSFDRRAGALIASQTTKRLLWPKISEPTPSSTSSSSQEPERASLSPRNLPATSTRQGEPQNEFAAVSLNIPPKGKSAQRFRVQVAAVHDEADAGKAWERLQAEHGVILVDMAPHIERAKTSAGDIYRIQTGAFQTRSAADRFCLQLEERGAICFVVAA